MDAVSRPEGPSRIPAGLTVVGDLTSSQGLTIDGTYDGQINLGEQHLEVGATARVKGKIVARDVTIAGRVEGTIVASGRVMLRPEATVRGHLQTATIVIADGARFDGTVDPSRTEAAMHVAKYREKAR